MADKHIEHIGATDADIRSNLDTLQIAIQTDDLDTFVWANSGASKYYYAAHQFYRDAGGATTYSDVSFKDITLTGDIYADGYIYRRGDTADNIRLENDQITTTAGNVEALYVEPKRIYTAVSMGIGGTPKSSILGVDGTMQLKEQAAAGGTDAGYGQFWVKNDAPCVPMFTNDAGSDSQLKTVGSAKAEMYMYEAAQTIAITTSDVYNGVYGFTTGSLTEWTFQDGRVVDADIVSEADNTALRIVTSAAHLLTTDDIVTLSNMNDAGHNLPTRVTVIDGTTFDCQDINYVAGAGVSSGTVVEPAYLQAGVSAPGDYSANYSMSADPDGNDDYKTELYVNATAQDKTASQLNFLNGLLGPLPGTGFLDNIVAGDRVWLALKNKTGTNDIVITHCNVNFHRL